MNYVASNARFIFTHLWNPRSKSQTLSAKSFVNKLNNVQQQLGTSDSLEKFKSILVAISFALKSETQSLELPIWNNKTKELSQRMFWTGVKLFFLVFQWRGILPDNSIEEIYTAFLNDKLLPYLRVVLSNSFESSFVATGLLKIVESVPQGYLTANLNSKFAILVNVADALNSRVEKISEIQSTQKDSTKQNSNTKQLVSTCCQIFQKLEQTHKVSRLLSSTTI